MNSLEELKRKLTLSAETTESDITNGINGIFEEIAKFLIESCSIQKEKSIYAFTDIEFYFYNKHHKDIITHPRDCQAMQWYVNDFGGIDLTFESRIESVKDTNKKGKSIIKPQLDDSSYFGGILIRGLKDINSDEELVGPWACAELFRLHDACGGCDFPTLIMKETGQSIPEPEARYHLVRKDNEQEIEKKVRYILSTYE
ncbi:MAG: peptidyl-arginine deiminase, partial [Bacteroidales bacterium]|nr:peptidyl-arginine deiminase [Candidatus Scybalocola fimicaballi]